MKIIYDKVRQPTKNSGYVPVELSCETMEEHYKKVLQQMRKADYDALVIYADREHGGNFAYLTGFEPRFEESLLVVFRNGACCLMLGNENLKMSKYSFVQGKTVHVPYFSLPNQPMYHAESMEKLIQKAGIKNGMKIGGVGWKRFRGESEGNNSLLDIPSFIVAAIRKSNPDGSLKNACDLFLDESKGVRIKGNANEIAHYEFGAGLASARMLEALNSIEIGKTEMEIAENLSVYGQPLTVTTICASGERFTNGVVFPRNKTIQKGDTFSMTLGLRGGLSSRAAYVAGGKEDLPPKARDYIERVAIPYYQAAVNWYESVGIGVSCKKVYQETERILPKEQFGWTLNPGHYTGWEEWTASPFYPDSEVVLESGMLLQMDIIPSVPGYGGVGAEDGVAIADEELQRELRNRYPETWRRMQLRKKYMKECLGITLKDEVLPLSDICGYLRPLLLNHECALKKVLD